MALEGRVERKSKEAFFISVVTCPPPQKKSFWELGCICVKKLKSNDLKVTNIISFCNSPVELIQSSARSKYRGHYRSPIRTHWV